MNAVVLSTMSLEEKLATMEQIWDDLCQHQNVQSPDWHGDVLQTRELNRLAGQGQPMDWQDAKKVIRQRTQ
jgi:Putative addiction module component